MRIGKYDIVVDSYAWIEYFAGTGRGELVRRHLEDAGRVYTPSIVLAEVARKYAREGASWRVVEERIRVVEELSAVVHVDSRIALAAARAYLELVKHAKALGLRDKPSLADAIVYATARVLGAKVVTGDKHFKELKDVIWLG